MNPYNEDAAAETLKQAAAPGEYVDILQRTIRELREKLAAAEAKNAELEKENGRLRAKCSRQRRELRRLNARHMRVIALELQLAAARAEAPAAGKSEECTHCGTARVKHEAGSLHCPYGAKFSRHHVFSPKGSPPSDRAGCTCPKLRPDMVAVGCPEHGAKPERQT